MADHYPLDRIPLFRELPPEQIRTLQNAAEPRPFREGETIFTQGEAGTEWHLLMAAAIFTALPIVVLFLFAQKQFVQGIANVGVKG